MFAEERKRYNSGLLPTKYNFFDETKYNRISLVDEINPTASGLKSMTAKSQNWKRNSEIYRLLQALIRFWMCTVSIENWKKSPAR